MGIITFSNHDIKFSLKDKQLVKFFLMRIFAEENIVFKSVSYVFCNDEFLLKLNQQYLNHDTLTDILTFTLSGSSLPIISEIYISIERVAENASNLKIDFLSEIYRVMIHGILHLCGYSDSTKSEKMRIRKKEDYYLSRI